MAVFSIFSISGVVFCLAACITAANGGESEIDELPFCNPDQLNTQHKLVFVSTLDGRLSALDPSDGGSVSWSVETGPGQMLSSSIHTLELTNNGQFVRMIPSLSGGIYKFDGSSIEPIPVTADLLLKSAPFSFSSDLAISGGKETRTYGVAVKTGKFVYECSMDGCTNTTENLTPDDIIVIQRHTQTVRAIEARTGTERWNFSVGQHELSFVSDTVNNCHQKDATPSQLSDDFELKVIVPEGLVCSVSKSAGQIIWKHKFDAPVVAAWYLFQEQMYPVDLFSGAQWTPTYNEQMGPLTPSLYIGMHNRQLYIQESVTLSKMSMKLATSSQSHIPQITWTPVSATAIGMVEAVDSDSGTKSPELGKTELVTIAQSILYSSEYSNGNGYYLFSAPKLQCDIGETENATIQELEDEENIDDFKMESELFSLWFWWKEVLVISISTAVLVNLVVTQRFLRAIHLLPITSAEVMEQEIIVVEKPVPMFPEPGPLQAHRSHSDPDGQQSSEFTSRFLTDFHPVHCLGKGGFGVVFEAKNKIDDCHYAIKRIPLPNRQESRDRVMREVKALAKLEHRHIVRYFNAWLECPPPGWQEEQDKLVPNCDGFCSLGDATSIDLSQIRRSAVHTHLSQDVSAKEECSSVFLNMKSDDSESYSFSQQIHRYNPDRSDSFIVFETSCGPKSKVTVDDDSGKDCSHEDGLDVVKSNTEVGEGVLSCTNSETSSNCVSAWREEMGRRRTLSTTECHEAKKKIGHKRPLSLDISRGGGIVMASLKGSRLYLFIQMQLCRRESLREWLRDNVSNRSTCVVLPMFMQIVQAVEYVHLQGLIHRDLKPSNIFFSLDGQIKVGDFGLVTAMVENNGEQRTPSPEAGVMQYADEKHTARVGTQLYMSPEQAQSLPYNYKVDIYSLGVILFELLVPFGTDMERSCTLMDLRSNKFPAHFQQQFQQEFELLQLMLSHSPEKRPTTYGIRARPPLKQDTTVNMNDQWHFELPPLRRDSSKTSSLSSSSSVESWEQV